MVGSRSEHCVYLYQHPECGTPTRKAQRLSSYASLGLSSADRAAELKKRRVED
jgi:hypothetical protein